MLDIIVRQQKEEEDLWWKEALAAAVAESTPVLPSEDFTEVVTFIPPPFLIGVLIPTVIVRVRGRPGAGDVSLK